MVIVAGIIVVAIDPRITRVNNRPPMARGIVTVIVAVTVHPDMAFRCGGGSLPMPSDVITTASSIRADPGETGFTRLSIKPLDPLTIGAMVAFNPDPALSIDFGRCP